MPIDQDIPVNLDVQVDIPLNQTDLHQPLVGLQQVLEPYARLLDGAPDSWAEMLCGRRSAKRTAGLCRWIEPVPDGPVRED